MGANVLHQFDCTIAEASGAGTSGGPVGPNEWNAGHQLYLDVNAQTGTSYAIQATDLGALITFNNASAVAASIAQAVSGQAAVGSTVNFYRGWFCFIKNFGAGTVTLTPTTSTINGETSLSLPTGCEAMIFSDGANYQAKVSSGVAPEPTYYTTGDGKFTLKTTADSGWVMANDGTIGSVSSGASSLASNSCQALFTLLFNNIDDADAPLYTSSGGSTTRSAQGSATAAWAANCRVGIPLQLGRGIAVAGAGAGLTARALGHADGAETVTLAAGNIPPLHVEGTGGALIFTNAGTNSLPNGSGGGAGDGGVTANPGVTPAAISTTGPRSYWNVMIKL